MILATKNRVIIRQVTEEKRSAGGLILDVKSSTDHTRGTVVHCGLGVEGISAGDIVYLSHLGTPVGDDLVSIPFEYIIAVEGA